MLCVEDQIDALRWAESIGGLKGLIARSQANLKAVEAWVEKSDWAAFLPETKETRSSTSICLVIKDDWFTALPAEAQAAAAKKLAALVEARFGEREHLARMTLSELDNLLREAGIDAVRVHRSWLVNRDMITETGLGFYALADRDTDEAMGFCGLAPVELPGILPEGAVEIGWRLATRFWGKGYVTEAAQKLLEHGLTTLGFAEIYAFAVQGNERSISVMRRLGMERHGDRDFDHPKVPDTHLHLKRHVLYWTTARTLKIRKKRNDQFTQT